MKDWRRCLLASVLLTGACASRPQAAPSYPPLEGECAEANFHVRFESPTATRVLISRFYAPSPTKEASEQAVAATKELAKTLRERGAAPHAGVGAAGQEGKTRTIEVIPLDCVIPDALAAETAGEATGAHIVLWGDVIYAPPAGNFTYNDNSQLYFNGPIIVGPRARVTMGGHDFVDRCLGPARDVRVPPSLSIRPRARFRRDEILIQGIDDKLDLRSLAEVDLPTLDGTLEVLHIVDVADGLHYYHQSKYWLAAQHFRHAAECVHVLEGKSKMDVMIGSAYLHLTDYPLAVEYLEKARMNVDPKRQDLEAAILNALAHAYEGTGDHRRALLSVDESLKITMVLREKEPASFDPSIYALRLNNKAMILTESGSFSEAQPLFKQALAILERENGHVHPRVAAVLNNLGRAAHLRGDYGGALVQYTAALEIAQQYYRSDHPDIATRLYNRGMVRQDNGDIQLALGDLRRAYQIHKQLLGEHPLVARDAEVIGSIYNRQGDSDKAKRYLGEAVTLYSDLFGILDERTARPQEKLAEVLWSSGDREGALTQLQAARDAYLTSRHPEPASRVLRRIQSLQSKSGGPDGAASSPVPTGAR